VTTHSESEISRGGGVAREWWLWIVEGPLRDCVTRSSGAAAFLLLALASVSRGNKILADAGHGIDELAAARLFATFCQTAFYLGFVWFTLIRGTPVKRAKGWQPRLSAMIGTFLCLGFGFLPLRSDLPLGWHFLSALLSLFGTGLAAFVVLPRLGRSFSLVPEARSLVTSGPYRIIRHPLYLVEEMAVFGAFIEVASTAAALLLIVQILFQIRRIYNEETLLCAAFPDYARYMESSARLIPGVW